MSCDNSMLYLDELTSSIAHRVEELLRNILNRECWSMWTSWDSVIYQYRSPLLVTGERTFSQESINNRFVTVVMDRKSWKEWWFENLGRIKWFSCLDDLYWIYLSKQDQAQYLYESAVIRLVEAWIEPRYCTVWWYILAVNILFEFYYDEAKLIEMIRNCLDILGLIWSDTVKEDVELQNYLTRIMCNKKAHLVIQDGHNKDIYRFIFTDEDVYEKSRWMLHPLVQSLNTHWQRIVIDRTQIVVEVKTNEAEKIDNVLWQIMEFVSNVNKYNVYNSTRSNAF
jgi:hypothetical protein